MTGLEKFIDAMRKDGRSDYGTVMQLALSILSEEKATATAKCVSGHDGGCPWYIPGSNPPSRHAADEPLAMDKRTALALIEYETTRARAVLDGMESENRGRERQGSAHAWPESCFAEVTDELEQKTKEARAYLNGLADKKENI
jgi:hypothetical protein